MNVAARTVLAVWLLCLMASGQEPENVLVVTNARSPLSTSIAEYYVRKRNIPSANVCSIRTTTEEIIQRFAEAVRREEERAARRRERE